MSHLPELYIGLTFTDCTEADRDELIAYYSTATNDIVEEQDYTAFTYDWGRIQVSRLWGGTSFGVQIYY